MAVRIGSPDSPVAAGMPVPGKPGSFYESGQFAPSIEQLMTTTFSEAKNAGLISTTLPIFGDNGDVDVDKINAWNPYDDLEGVHASTTIPKFSMATLLTAQKAFPGLFKVLHITNIMNGDEIEAREGVNFRAMLGDQLITANTSSQGRVFRSTLYVYSKYYQYISTPIVPEVPGRTKGISVSMFATLKACGHILFLKLAFDGELEFIGRYFKASGWSKTPGEGERGHYLTLKNMASFYRKPLPASSEISKYSPMEDFADTFAHYLSHRVYLQSKFPEKFEVMDEICKKYRIG